MKEDIEDIELSKFKLIKSIFQRVQEGDISVIDLICKEDINPNLANKDGWALLHIAVRTYSELLNQEKKEDNNAQINYTNYYELIKRLITEAGANPNVLTKEGWSPLHMAILDGNIDVVKLLLELNANVNVPGGNDQTSLHAATAYQRVNSSKGFEIIKLLLQAGASLDSVDKVLGTPLHHVAESGDTNILRFFLHDCPKINRAKVNAVNRDGQTPLHLAAMQSNLNVVETLLQAHAKVNALDKQKQTPLHFAAMGRHKDEFKKQSLQIIELLLSEGAQIDAIDSNGETPLYQAIEKGNTESVQFLLDAGSAFDVTNSKKSTPLHLAAKKGNADIVELLIDKGADVNKKDKDGDTPLHFVAKYNHVKVLELLLATMDSYFWESSIDPNLKNKDGQTPLHLAAKAGFTAIVKKLVEAGTDINVTDKNEQTPLQLAFAKDHHEVVKVLTELGRFTYKNFSAKQIDEMNRNKIDLGEKNSGKFGKVYKSNLDGMPVALKKIKIAPKTKDSKEHEDMEKNKQEETPYLSSRKKISTEVVALSLATSSEHIVKFFGAYFEQDCCYLVMQFMAGGSLLNCFEKVIPWKISYQIAIDVARALLYLHEKNLIHSDIKSGNILLSDEKLDDSTYAKLGDLGSTKEKLIDLGTIWGPSREFTPKWRAPELEDENAKTTKKSDIYSFGVVLFELAINSQPRSKVATAENIKATNAPKIFQEIIIECINEEPEKRPNIGTVLKKLQIAKQELEKTARSFIILQELLEETIIVPESKQNREPVRIKFTENNLMRSFITELRYTSSSLGILKRDSEQNEIWLRPETYNAILEKQNQFEAETKEKNIEPTQTSIAYSLQNTFLPPPLTTISAIPSLIRRAKKVINSNNTVSIIFLEKDKELAKELQSKLYQVGIRNLSMHDEPRKIDYKEADREHSQDRFIITLTPDEYNGLMGENAFEKLLEKGQSQSLSKSEESDDEQKSIDSTNYEMMG